MQQIAFGHLKMSNSEFWDSLPREFFNRLTGYSEEKAQIFETEQLSNRMLMFWITINNPYIDKKDKPETFAEFNAAFSDKKDNKTINKKLSKAQTLSLMNIKD